MIRIGLLSAPCGAGKTFVAAEYAISLALAGEKVLICQPSLQLIDQTITSIRQKNPNVRTTTYHSGTHEGFVIPQLSAHFQHADEGGEILLITHAALERIGYIENKTDWHLLYDEVPQIDWSFTFTLDEHRVMLLDLINTMAAEESGDYLVVEARDNGRMRELSRNIHDDMVQDIFREMATKIESAHSAVYVLREQFENFAAGRINQLTMFALVSPSIFAGFGSVNVLAARVEDSMMSRYWTTQTMYDVEFHPANKLLKALRYKTHPNGAALDIYYAVDKPWSKSMRDKVITPHSDIRTVQEWIESMAVEEFNGEPFVYMVNKDREREIFDKPHIQRMIGKYEQLPNTTHGLNQFQTYNNVAIFSALNPPPAHYKFLEQVARIDPEEVKAAGYRQAVYQAAMRTSLRDPSNTNRKKVVVMDKPTAVSLQREIPGSRRQKFQTIDLDLAIEGIAKKQGRPKKWASDAERKAHDAQRKRNERAQKKLKTRPKSVR